MKKLFSLLTALSILSLGAVDVTDVKVDVRDKFGGDAGAVLSRCQTRPGVPYDPVMVSRDVTALNESGEFQEISADATRNAKGVTVTFSVYRKVRYQAPLEIAGNSFFSASKVTSEADLQDGGLYSEGDLADAAARVRAAYWKKNFPQAKVSIFPRMIPGGNNCTLRVVIDEGERQKVHDYVFEGAKHADADDLRATFDVFPWWNPKGWFSDSPVSDDQLAQAADKVRAYYNDLGYLDAQVAMPVRVPDGTGRVNILFKVTEGSLYKIGEQSITGVTRYSPDLVMAKSELPQTGSVAGAKTLADAAHRVMVTVGSGDSGLADTRVDVKRIPREDDPQVLDVVYVVTEGVPVVINDVVIEGNDYTKDKVIRREIALGPGDRMLEDRAERSQRRLENLDYFARVRYSLRQTNRGKDASGAEYRDLVYEVEEKNTGSFMIGLGASSIDSIYLSAELSQANFDLFAPGKWFRGAGQKGRIYAQVGPRIQTYEAAVTEPHLFDRLLELTVEAYRRQRWYDEYDLVRNGAAATLAYPVKFWPTWEPFGRFGVRLSAELISFEDVDDAQYYVNGSSDATRPLFKDEGSKYGDAAEAVLRLFWSHDTRDNFRIATRGGRTQVFGDLAGGDNSYWRLGVNHRQYFNVWRRYKHILMASVRAETIDSFSESDGVPIYNRMFLGGPRSIRGVEYRNVAPLREKAGGGDWSPWGGQTLFCMNFEYTVPIVQMLRLAAFTDLGSVGEEEFDLDFSDTFAWTVGIGIRLDIPMFPIRLDFATPLKKPDHAEEELFSFSVGYDF